MRRHTPATVFRFGRAGARRRPTPCNAGGVKAIPTISKYMSTSPHSIGPAQSLATAHKLFRDHEIRHLPVLDGGRLVGLLTTRDVTLVESFESLDTNATKVEDVMATSVYTTSPDAALDEVCDHMAQHKYGSAVVVQNNHVVGIFTTVDICRATAELLRSRLKS
jgi:acetoin utilization protein AcuB